MSKKRGRPKKEIPKNVVQDLIYRYTKDYNVTGKIGYMDVYRFSQELFKNGEIEHDIGEFYWRKGEGRDAIDKANKVIVHSHKDPFVDDESFINTEDAVNKFFSGNKADKQKLIGALKMNEIKLQKYIQRTNNLEKELYALKQDIEKEREQSIKWKKDVEKYEERMFQWMELSINKDIPLINILSTGKSRTKTVEELLKSIFSENPLEVFDRMKDIIKHKKVPNSTIIQDEPISMESFKNKKKSVLDDFDF
jgi:hypothetical protein